MDHNIFIELHNYEYSYSKLIKRNKNDLIKIVKKIPIDKYYNFSTNQLADLINFFVVDIYLRV